jgi:hypothetical protein
MFFALRRVKALDSLRLARGAVAIRTFGRLRAITERPSCGESTLKCFRPARLLCWPVERLY